MEIIIPNSLCILKVIFFVKALNLTYHTHTHYSLFSHSIAFTGVLRLLGDIRTQRLGFTGLIMGCWCMTPPGAQALGTTCHHLVLGRLE